MVGGDVAGHEAKALRERLAWLYRDAGSPKRRELEHWAERQGQKLPRQTISDLLSPTRTNIPRLETIELFVGACAAWATKQTVVVDPELLDRQGWISARDLALGTSRPPATRTPRTIADWNPFDLDIHHAITSSDDTPVPDLPAYFRRTHDDELDNVLSDVSASVLVMLVGGSSTGKTRAIFEAVNGTRNWLPGRLSIHDMRASFWMPCGMGLCRLGRCCG